MHHPRREHFSQSTPVRTFVFVIGTRPEVIKVAPIIRRLREAEWATVRIVTSGQQSDLLDSTLAEFGLRPDFSIPHRSNCRTPAVLASLLIRRLDKYFGEVRPDCVLAQGDTTTAYASSIAAFYRRIAFVHVEAGLRTPSLDAPFPEEFHRRSIAVSTSLHCAPTSAAAQNLTRENISREKILVSGNTVIDSLLEVAASKPAPPADFPRLRTILLTAHRRENFGAPLRDAFTAIRAFVDLTPDVAVYFPVHPNPNARETAIEILSGHPRIKLVDPLGYRDIVEGWVASGEYPVTFIPTVSRPNDPSNADWIGRTGRVESIVAPIVEELGLDSGDTIAYLCGNPDMIQSAEVTLLELGFPEPAVKKELYWPKGKEPRGVAGAADAAAAAEDE